MGGVGVGRRRLAPWAPPQAEVPVAGGASGGKGRWAPKGKEEMVGVSIEGREGGPSRRLASFIRCGHHNWVMVLTTHLHSGCISVYIVDPHIDGKVTEIPTI